MAEGTINLLSIITFMFQYTAPRFKFEPVILWEIYISSYIYFLWHFCFVSLDYSNVKCVPWLSQGWGKHCSNAHLQGTKSEQRIVQPKIARFPKRLLMLKTIDGSTASKYARLGDLRWSDAARRTASLFRCLQIVIISSNPKNSIRQCMNNSLDSTTQKWCLASRNRSIYRF